MKTKKPIEASDSRIRARRGRIYFSRETERKFFFGATVLMLLAGILFKVGLF